MAILQPSCKNNSVRPGHAVIWFAYIFFNIIFFIKLIENQ